jgi:hypothetical protein
MFQRFLTRSGTIAYYTKLKMVSQFWEVEFYVIIISYLHRTFIVKYKERVMQLKETDSGIP